MSNIGNFNYNLAILIFFIGLLGFLFHNNLIMLVISLELILLSMGLFFVQISIGLDDIIGSNITLFLLPLAGAESAIALAILIGYYPIRGGITLNS